MEIKIQKPEFLKALSWTQSIVERRSTMPILANALIDAKAKTLRVTATDLEVGVTAEYPAEVIKPGRIAVQAKGLFDIVKELPQELVHIKIVSNNWVEITCGKTKFKIAGTAADEFPELPRLESAASYSMEIDAVVDMVNKTSFAISTDETRYNLNGVFLQASAKDGKNNLRMVATDGHRLSYEEKAVKGKWKIGDGVIIPRKGISEIKKLLEGNEGEFTLEVDQKNVRITKDNVTLVVRLVDGQFPPYEQVIPKDNTRVLSINKDILIKALRRVSLLSSERSKGVKFQISPGNLVISSSNPDFGEAREELTVVYKGETFDVGFNARYFLDVLNVIEDEQVVLELKNDVNPCVIRSEFDKGLLSVIMPMRL